MKKKIANKNKPKTIKQQDYEFRLQELSEELKRRMIKRLQEMDHLTLVGIGREMFYLLWRDSNE